MRENRYSTWVHFQPLHTSKTISQKYSTHYAVCNNRSSNKCMDDYPQLLALTMADISKKTTMANTIIDLVIMDHLFKKLVLSVCLLIRYENWWWVVLGAKALVSPRILENLSISPKLIPNKPIPIYRHTYL